MGNISVLPVSFCPVSFNTAVPRFTIDVVQTVRSSTCNALPPTFTRGTSGASFWQFARLTVNEVITAVRRLPGHSTETAVLRVLSDILQTVDRGDLAALVLLDLSEAFHTVDHSILSQRLQLIFGINDVAHQWFQSYLCSQKQHVRRGLQISGDTFDVWRPTRVCSWPDLVCPLYCRPHLGDRKSWFISTYVR